MHLHNRLTDRQSQTNTSLGICTFRTRRVKQLENMRQICRSDSTTLIQHLKQYFSLLLLRLYHHTNFFFLRCVLHCIVHQIHENLFHQSSIHRYHQQFFRNIHRNFSSWITLCHMGNCTAQNLLYRLRLLIQDKPAILEPREIQDVFYQRQQPIGILIDARGQLTALLVLLQHIHQKFRTPHDSRQRSPQIV